MKSKPKIREQVKFLQMMILNNKECPMSSNRHLTVPDGLRVFSKADIRERGKIFAAFGAD